MAEEHNQTDDHAAAMGQETQQNFAMRSIYLKDSSFESPNTPAVFLEDIQPQFEVNVGNSVNQVDESLHEVILTLSITAKTEDKTVFLAEIQQAGIFESQGLQPQQLHQILGTFAPTQLFPYAREAANSLVQKGGFPSVMLQPINFDALYAQHVQQLAAQQQAAAVQNPPAGNA